MDFISLADRIARGTHNAGHSAAEWRWIFIELKLSEDQYVYFYSLPDHQLIDYCMGRPIPGTPPPWVIEMQKQMLCVMIRYEVEVLGLNENDP